MTGKLSFQVSLITGTNNFVAALYDTSNPTSVIEAILVPKTGGSYPPNFQVSFTTSLVNGHMYRGILWETSGTTPGGVSRGSVDFDATMTAAAFQAPLYLTADASAGLVSGTNTYVNAALIGWGIELEIPGSGTAFPGAGVDYTFDPTTGAITYLLGNWNPAQRIVVRSQPKITTALSSGGGISSGEIITASTTLLNTDKNKAVFVQGAFTSVVLTLPALSTLTDFDHITIYSAGGSHLNCIINAAGTDKIQRKAQIAQIILCQQEKLDLFKANGVWNIDYIPAAVDQVGETFYRQSDLTKLGPRELFQNGALLSRTQYPGLFAYMQNLDANAIIAEAHWADTISFDSVFTLNTGKWTFGDGSTTFRVPRVYDKGFIRAVDGVTSKAGDAQADMMPKHSHDTLTGDFPGEPNGHGPAKLHGNYNGTATGNTDLTSPPMTAPAAGVAGTALIQVGGETHPTNVFMYALIRI